MNFPISSSRRLSNYDYHFEVSIRLPFSLILVISIEVSYQTCNEFRYYAVYRRIDMLAVSFVKIILITAVVDIVSGETNFVDKDSKLRGFFEPQWFKENIPFVEFPDKAIEDVYYYRWSSLKRHLRYTVPGAGYIITEFVHKVGYSQKFDTISAAAGHHIYEARWLRNTRYVQVSQQRDNLFSTIDIKSHDHRITLTSGREKEEPPNNIQNG